MILKDTSQGKKNSDKKIRYQPHAFLLLPISFNVAAMFSPLMAGQLADLAGKYPEKFGNNAFLKAWPYAPPALLSGFFLLIAFGAVFFFLEEVRDPRLLSFRPVANCLALL